MESTLKYGLYEKDMKLSNKDKLRIIFAGLVGGTIGSIISLILHYYISNLGIIPGF